MRCAPGCETVGAATRTRVADQQASSMSLGKTECCLRDDCSWNISGSIPYQAAHILKRALIYTDIYNSPTLLVCSPKGFKLRIVIIITHKQHCVVFSAYRDPLQLIYSASQGVFRLSLSTYFQAQLVCLATGARPHRGRQLRSGSCDTIW